MGEEAGGERRPHKQQRVDGHGDKVTVSCPGKVLVAGGYAVLERPNLGLVLATTARFHTDLEWLEAGDGQSGHATTSAGLGRLGLVVRSPQYRQTFYLHAKHDEDAGRIVLEHAQGEENKYVEQTVAFGLAGAAALSQRWALAHDLERLINNEQGQLDQASFAHIMEVLGFHFDLAQTAFSVGDERNAATANQNSLRVLVASELLGLDRATTLKLWGEHYRGVLAEPEGDGHGNLRNYLRGAEASIDGGAEAAVRHMSAGAKTLAARRRTTHGARSVDSEGSSWGSLLAAHNGDILHITLRADNDFYSQQAHLDARGLPYTNESLQALDPFLPCCNDKGEAEISKTGLGSSAAMVSSIVAGLAKMAAPEVDVTPGVLSFVHGVAQLAHGVIQGKIGSGFDVCAAVHGSMTYVRYDPEVLAEAMAQTLATGNEQPGTKRSVVTPPSALLSQAVSSLNHKVTPFQLPPRLELMCGDVRGGSETPSMSRKILAWRAKAEGPELDLWNELVSSNDKVAAAFNRLHDLAVKDADEYNAALDACATKSGWQNLEAKGGPTPLALLDLRAVFFNVRRLFREIGRLADVPVEPPCQTELCDATMAQPGVVLCGVPGAGGFDAVFAVVVDVARDRVARAWAAREGDARVCALLLSESREHPGVVFQRSP